MAILKYGAMVTYMAGKSQGHCFKRNGPSGVLMSNPFNTGKSLLLDTERLELFKTLQTQRLDLSASFTSGYNSIGERLPIPDWEGNNRYLYAQQIVSRLQAQRIAQGTPTVPDPDNFTNWVGSEPLRAFTFIISIGSVSVSAPPPVNSVQQDMYYYPYDASLPSPSLAQLIYIGSVVRSVTVGPETFDLYNTYLGGLTAGMQFYVGWRQTNEFGYKGVISWVLATVTA